MAGNSFPVVMSRSRMEMLWEGISRCCQARYFSPGEMAAMRLLSSLSADFPGTCLTRRPDSTSQTPTA